MKKLILFLAFLPIALFAGQGPSPGVNYDGAGNVTNPPILNFQYPAILQVNGANVTGGGGTVQNLSTGSTGFTASGNGTGTLTFSGQLNLANISTTSAVSNQVLTYNGTVWSLTGNAASNSLNLGASSNDHAFTGSTDVGVGTGSYGINATTLGYLASAAASGTAVGATSNATTNAEAFGNSALANGQFSIVLGDNIQTTGSHAILINTRTLSSNNSYGIIIGGQDTDSADNFPVIIGEQTTDYGNLSNSAAANTTMVGGDIVSYADGVQAFGSNITLLDSFSTAAGVFAETDGSGSTAFGYFPHTYGQNEINIGGGAGYSISQGEGIGYNNAYIASQLASRYYRYPFTNSPILKDATGAIAVFHGQNGIDATGRLIAGNFTTGAGIGGAGALVAFANITNGSVHDVQVLWGCPYSPNMTVTLASPGAGTGATFTAVNSAGNCTSITVGGTTGNSGGYGTGYSNTTPNLNGGDWVVDTGKASGNATPGSFRVEVASVSNISSNQWTSGGADPTAFTVGPAAFGSTTAGVATVNGTLTVANTTTLSSLTANSYLTLNGSKQITPVTYSGNTVLGTFNGAPTAFALSGLTVNATTLTASGGGGGTNPVISSLNSDYTTTGSASYINCGISCSVVAGKTYTIRGAINANGSASMGFQLNGTATFSSSNGNSVFYANQVNQVTPAFDLLQSKITGASFPLGNTESNSTSGGNIRVEYDGNITVTGNGTITVQVCDFTQAGESVNAGSILICTPQ